MFVSLNLCSLSLPSLIFLFSHTLSLSSSLSYIRSDIFFSRLLRCCCLLLRTGCADARVPANEIMGEDAGSVFVVRNVANLVVNTDFNLMAALQYAVSVLQVPHIIVCGHYDCGGVRASVLSKDHVPPLENWLRNIRDVYVCTLFS
jgi:hypothetical protein